MVCLLCIALLEIYQIGNSLLGFEMFNWFLWDLHFRGRIISCVKDLLLPLTLLGLRTVEKRLTPFGHLASFW